MSRPGLRETLVGRLREAMERRRWDEERLAERARVSLKTVQRVLQGESCKLSTLEHFADVLSVDLLDTICPESASKRPEALEIARDTPRPVVGWKAASQHLGVPISTLRQHRRALGDRKKRPWWASVEALQFWYDGLTTSIDAPSRVEGGLR